MVSGGEDRPDVDPEDRDRSGADPEDRDRSGADPEDRDRSGADPEDRDRSDVDPEGEDRLDVDPEDRDRSDVDPGERTREEAITPQSASFRQQQYVVGVGGAVLAGVALAVSSIQHFPNLPNAAGLLAGVVGGGLVYWLVRHSLFPTEEELPE